MSIQSVGIGVNSIEDLTVIQNKEFSTQIIFRPYKKDDCRLSKRPKLCGPRVPARRLRRTDDTLPEGDCILCHQIMQSQNDITAKR